MRHAGGWLALAALVFFPFATDNFELPHQLVLALGAVVLSNAAPRFVVPRPWLVVVALLGGAALISTLTSVAWSLSLPGLISLVTVGAFSLVAVPLDASRRRDVLVPVLWTTLPLAVWALVQGVGLDPFVWGDAARWCGGLRPFATLGHPTQLGVWMAMITVLALEHARATGQRLQRSPPSPGPARLSWLHVQAGARWLLSAVAALTCVLTLSRAGWLALAVGVGSWLLLSGVRPTRRHVLFTLPLVAVVGLVAGPAPLLERLTHFFVAPTRVQMWGTAFAGFRAHPWLGWGFDTFVLVDQQLRHPDAWRYEWGGTAGHAHSLVPQTFATQGLLGVGVLLGCVVVVVRAWRAQPVRDAGLVGAVLALGAASMVAFSGVLVMALGACCLALSVERKPVALPGWAPLATLVPLALSVSMFAASACVYRAQARGDERWFRAAEHLEPWRGPWWALHGEWLEQRGALPESLTAYTRATEVMPGAAVFEANVGRVQAKLGDAAKSLAAFERARRHAPLDARIALDAAEASFRLHDEVLVERTLLSVLGLYPTDAPAWLLLARLRLQQGRALEARAALEAAVKGDWRDWPEGLGVATSALAQVLAASGDPALALEVLRGPEVFALPGDACGAPSLLAR